MPLALLGDGGDGQRGAPRTQPVVIAQPQNEEQTLTLHLEHGLSVAELPSGMSFHTAAADGALEVSSPAPDLVIVRRRVTFHPGQWPRAAFDELGTLLRQLAAASERTIVVKQAP